MLSCYDMCMYFILYPMIPKISTLSATHFITRELVTPRGCVAVTPKFFLILSDPNPNPNPNPCMQVWYGLG